MRTIVIFFLAMHVFVLSSFSQLKPGDIAVIGYNFQDPDQFSFITLVDLEEGTEVNFTDSGWKADQTFRENEGIVTYRVPAGGIKAGKVITFPKDPGFTTMGVSGFFGLSTQGDQILIYQGEFSNPTFLFGLTNTRAGTWDENATSNNTSSLPSGLVDGVTAVSIDFLLNAYYNCVIVFGTENLVASISNQFNWVGGSSHLDLPTPCSIKLPVLLSDLFIVELNGTAEIKFSTSYEYDSWYFLIEKSVDDGLFHEIGTVTSVNKEAGGSYYFIDKNFSKSSYYRLTQLDKDGDKTIFEPVFLQKNKQSLFSVSTKIGQTTIHTDYPSFDWINVFSLQGALLVQFSGAREDLFKLEEKIGELPEGQYIVSYLSDCETGAIKFIK